MPDNTSPTNNADTPLTALRFPVYRKPRAVFLFAAVFMTMLASDLVVKNITHNDPLLIQGGERLIIPNILALKMTINHGAVFGMWQGKKTLFIGATLIAVIVVGYFFGVSPPHQWWVHVALAFILAGAIGNLYDRVFFGGVRDMLYLFPDVNLPFNWTWPGGTQLVYPWIFNLADVYLLAGIGVCLIQSFFDSRAEITSTSTA